MKLSIIIPVYNEVATIRSCLEKVTRLSLLHLQLDREIIVVDDGSTDGTTKILKSSPT